jgi:3-hydroxyacyl-[acyl-carrier-protein] dehydratase
MKEEYNTRMSEKEILSALPYDRPFLFVDSLEAIDEDGVRGSYTYDADHEFYKGHFKGRPVTPGVILTETMAQIGVVCLGIFLLGDQIKKEFPKIALTSSAMDYFIPVYPGERVEVVSKREVWRFGKLRCMVKMYNSKKELVCRGKISGMVQV